MLAVSRRRRHRAVAVAQPHPHGHGHPCRRRRPGDGPGARHQHRRRVRRHVLRRRLPRRDRRLDGGVVRRSGARDRRAVAAQLADRRDRRRASARSRARSPDRCCTAWSRLLARLSAVRLHVLRDHLHLRAACRRARGPPLRPVRADGSERRGRRTTTVSPRRSVSARTQPWLWPARSCCCSPRSGRTSSSLRDDASADARPRRGDDRVPRPVRRDGVARAVALLRGRRVHGRQRRRRGRTRLKLGWDPWTAVPFALAVATVLALVLGCALRHDRPASTS